MKSRMMVTLKNKFRSIFNPRIRFGATIGFAQIDKTASIHIGCRLNKVTVGKYSYIARNTLLQNVEIGNFCSISENCNIGMPSHPAHFVSSSPVFLKGKNTLRKNFSKIEYINCPHTLIGNDVWIGANVLIKAGITIGDGAIIGAGAVVVKDVPPYAIVVGVPGNIIKYRFPKEIIDALLISEWWKWSDDKIQMYSELIDKPELFIERQSKRIDC